MNIRHLMVPGLSRRHLRAWRLIGMPFPAPDVEADLVCTFPFSLETVETTLLTGVEPIEHGRSFVSDACTLPKVDAIVDHARDETLALALVDQGFGSTAETHALSAVARRIESLLGPDTRVIVSGGPAFHRVLREVDPGILPAGSRCSGSMARLGGPSDDAAYARLLGTDGVERILRADALGSWRAPAGEPVLVLESDAGFGSVRATWGRRDLDGTDDGAVVLVWGAAPGRWPQAVHDHRIAPTLAAGARADWPTATDGPLLW